MGCVGQVKKTEYIEKDFIVDSQDAVLKTVETMDSKVFKKSVLRRLKEYQITQNQFDFLLDATIDSLKSD